MPDTNLVKLSATPNEPLVGPVPTVDLLRYAPYPPRAQAGPWRTSAWTTRYPERGPEGGGAWES